MLSFAERFVDKPILNMEERYQKLEKDLLDIHTVLLCPELNEPYRASVALSARLNRLIYAAVAILTLLCGVTATIAGAGVISTAAITAAGLGIGISAARFTIWQTNKKPMKSVDQIISLAQSHIPSPVRRKEIAFLFKILHNRINLTQYSMRRPLCKALKKLLFPS